MGSSIGLEKKELTPWLFPKRTLVLLGFSFFVNAEGLMNFFEFHCDVTQISFIHKKWEIRLRERERERNYQWLCTRRNIDKWDRHIELPLLLLVLVWVPTRRQVVYNHQVIKYTLLLYFLGLIFSNSLGHIISHLAQWSLAQPNPTTIYQITPPYICQLSLNP